MRIVSKRFKDVYDYRIACEFCDTVVDLEQKDLILREIKNKPVNSYYCPVCKRRNYFFVNSYTQKLIFDFDKYIKEHPALDEVEA